MQYRLHPLRAKQLRHLAKVRNLTLSATVESLIDARAVAGEIPDVIDGINFRRENDALVIELDGRPLPAVAPEAARAFAEELRHVAGGSITATVLQLDAEQALGAQRNGHGVCFEAGTARLLASASIASTIARQIDAAAA